MNKSDEVQIKFIVAEVLCMHVIILSLRDDWTRWVWKGPCYSLFISDLRILSR